jgi:hypothetical protein
VTSHLVKAPAGRAGDNRILAVSCEGIPRLDRDQDSALTFIGGFDREETANDLTRTTSFLALSYPIRDVQALKGKLGSIDLEGDSKD